MLQRPLPATPTFTFTFEHSISAPPTVFDYNTSFATSCPLCITRNFPLENKYSTASWKRRRTMNISASAVIPVVAMETDKEEDTIMSPLFPHINNTLRSNSALVPLGNLAAGQQDSSSSNTLAEKDMAGPSRLGLAFRREGMFSRKRNKNRKVPARLLSPPRPADRSNSLQLNDSLLCSRSVPTSPVAPSGFGKEVNVNEDDRERLRDSLRGSPRRRPSVPFGLKIAKLPSLSIPSQGGITQLSKDAPPPIWQDPSEHALSGNGSSLQHARSVYASGPVEVLPGLFLGDEFNARDDQCLARLGITTILNVAKETTLPFQINGTSEELDLLGSASLSRGMQNVSIGEATATPTSSSKPVLPKTAARESFFSPLTSIMPMDSTLPPLQNLSADYNKLIYLRNTISTPNLHSPYDMTNSDGHNDASDEETSPLQPSNGSSPPSPSAALPSLDSLQRYSPANLTTTTPSSHSDQTTATSTTSSFATPSITLPHNAIALNIIPSPQTGRPQALRYIKLPWTHDETELAGHNAGGFVTGCSIIADTLGIDLTTGRVSNARQAKEGILVHCQCGVSRSATLVIAFVMQAAAYNYDFAITQKLTGMHDCYEMVKELSSSISPNCSLIYQLVEWERYLSRQIIDAAQVSQASRHPSALLPDKKWGKEALNEEDWTRMRMDEERKEKEEEDRIREERLRESKKTTPSKSLSNVQDKSSTSNASGGATGIGARRRRPTPSLMLASSAKTTADLVVKEQTAALASAAPLITMQEAEEDREDNTTRALTTPLRQTFSAIERPLRNSMISPYSLKTPLTNNSSNNSGTSTLLSGISPSLSATFGAHGQSPAERRSKHKRTFSSELPSWNGRSSITMTDSKAQ